MNDDFSKRASALKDKTPVLVLSRIEKRKGKRFVTILLAWFEVNRREFPWRPPKSPYHSAISEILLQKTSAANALPVFKRFVRAFPSIRILANASLEEIAEIVHPLGLPRRAELLLSLAGEVVSSHNGRFPGKEAQLQKLPGIGPYCAGAIASQAFGQKAAMIDVNVMRIIGRVFSIKSAPHSNPSRRLRDFVVALMPTDRIVDFNLALLDFGALVCKSRDPRCGDCPLAKMCDYNRCEASPENDFRE